MWSKSAPVTGADPGFQVRGGALKKIAPNGGRRENVWGISCEKSRFYANKSYFLRAGSAPPLDPPLHTKIKVMNSFLIRVA